MLADRSRTTFLLDDADRVGDRSMTVLQYATGSLALVAAILLAFVR
ncbi:MAG: hypothetical protein ABIP77_09715 [Candidatus Limnocylindrales bacterium]